MSRQRGPAHSRWITRAEPACRQPPRAPKLQRLLRPPLTGGARDRMAAGEERGVGLLARVELRVLQALAQHRHEAIADLVGRVAQRAAIEAHEPALEAPGHAIDEERPRRAAIDGRIGLARGMDL